MPNGVKYRYDLSEQAVNFLLNALNRVSIQGIQNAKNLITVMELLQNPLNADELEKEHTAKSEPSEQKGDLKQEQRPHEALKNKFEGDKKIPLKK
jgi:hypothetical protein